MKTSLEYAADRFDFRNLPIWVIPQVKQVRRAIAERLSWGDSTEEHIQEQMKTIRPVDFIRWADGTGVLYFVIEGTGAVKPLPVVIQKHWMNLEDVGSRARYL